MYFFNLKQKGKERWRTAQEKKGFFLAELIVSVFIFGIVMTISVGSLILALDANRKTQSLKSVLNNLNVVLDTMTRTIATGSHYYCGTLETGDLNATDPLTMNCEINVDNPEITVLSNNDIDGNGQNDDFVTYKFIDDNGRGYVARTIRSGSDEVGPVRMSAPEVDIDRLSFAVNGTEVGTAMSVSNNQPRVFISLKGNAGAGPRNQPTEFVVQTVVSQRIPDL